jgi:predicted Zn-dependent peptidase
MVMAESLFAGTERHDRAAFAAAVEIVGGSLSARAEQDRFEVGGSVLAARTGTLLELLAEVLTEATYPPEAVRADKERVAEEVVLAGSQPEVRAGEALRRRLYGSHPYATGMPTPEAVRAVGAASLRRLHDDVLRPKGSHLVLVGDLPADVLLGLAEESLARWLRAAGSQPTEIEPLPPVHRGPIQLVERAGAVQSNLRVASPAPRRTDRSWPAAMLANLVFGGMFSSRLVENLREDKGYTYSPHSGIGHGRAGSSLVVQAEVATEVTARALLEMRYELGRAATGGFSAEEIESARRYALGTLAFSTATQAGLAGMLAALAANGLGPAYLGTHGAALAALTADEVNVAASELLAPERMVTVVVGDSGRVLGGLSTLDAVDAVQG